MTALSAAFRMVRIVLEKQREACLDTLKALSAAEAAGIPARALLDAVRLDRGDFFNRLPDMQIIAELLAAIGSPTRIDALVIVDDPLATAEERDNYYQDQGFLAYHSGVKKSDNPHGARTVPGIAWEQGFQRAKDLDIDRHD